MKSYFLTIAASAIALSTAAQGLHKEIEVEREITPTETEATRYSLLPELSLPEVTPLKLKLSDQAVTAPVRPAFSHLNPVLESAGLSDEYAGYVRAGIFPLFNADASAGYRILNTDRTRLSAWLQYSGNVYRRDIPAPDGDRRYWRDHRVAGGADIHQAIGKKSTLDAGAAYAYDRYNMYTPAVGAPGYNMFAQWVHRFNADATYSYASGANIFKAGLHFDRFSFGQRHFVPAREHVYRANAGYSMAVSEGSRLSFDVDGVMIHRSVYKIASTRGLITIRPVYAFLTGENKFTGHAGISASASINDGTVFSLAPDVMLGWNPTSYFGAELKATGGAVVNTLSQLYEQSPYMYTGCAYGHSNIPYDLSATVIAGPIHGAYAKLTGGYARAKHFLMPDAHGAIEGHGVAYRGTKLSGYYYRVAIGWRHRYFSIEGSYAMAPSSYNKGYYMWRDRARRVAAATLEVTPIKRLAIKADFEVRQGRAVYDVTSDEAKRINIGNAASLDAEVRYEATRRLTLWASGSNLLNYHYVYLGDRPAQGITALVGVAYKF